MLLMIKPCALALVVRVMRSTLRAGSPAFIILYQYLRVDHLYSKT